MPKILLDFLYYLSGVLGYSENTIKAYFKDLMQFFGFIKVYMEIPVEIENYNIFILGEVKEHHIIAFLVYLNFTKNNSPETRQRKLSSIRRFYKWLFSTFPYGYNKENPTKHIENIEKMVRLPKYLTLSQSKRIQKVFNKKNSIYYIRNNAIISTFLSTGIRVGELTNINICDVNLKRKTIVINRGKGKKERIVYLNKIAKQQLEKYLQDRYQNEKLVDMNSPLFLNKYNTRISIFGVEDICQKAYELLGLKDFGYTTHTLRHSAATLLYQNTKDILLVKEFLGHAGISSTEIYAHIENEDVRNAINKNPLNQYELEKVA